MGHRKDAKEFTRAFEDSLEANQKAKPAGEDGTFRVKDAGVAISSSSNSTTVAYAPTPRLATRLSKRSSN